MKRNSFEHNLSTLSAVKFKFYIAREVMLSDLKSIVSVLTNHRTALNAFFHRIRRDAHPNQCMSVCYCF